MRRSPALLAKDVVFNGDFHGKYPSSLNTTVLPTHAFATYAPNSLPQIRGEISVFFPVLPATIKTRPCFSVREGAAASFRRSFASGASSERGPILSCKEPARAQTIRRNEACGVIDRVQVILTVRESTRSLLGK